jgi:hypothetical protein
MNRPAIWPRTPFMFDLWEKLRARAGLPRTLPPVGWRSKPFSPESGRARILPEFNETSSRFFGILRN